MSVKNTTPIVGTPSNMMVAARAEQNRDQIPNRPSYTPDNAMAWKPLFDKMIDTMANQEICARTTGLKPNTMYIKANDALRWLMECGTEREKYALFRSRVSIRRLSNGILIYFKKTVANIIEAATTPSGKTWKDDIQEWISTAQSGDIFERRNISVSDDQREWLVNLLSGLDGTEMDVGADHVRVMR